jgi:hypothetical protein
MSSTARVRGVLGSFVLLAPLSLCGSLLAADEPRRFVSLGPNEKLVYATDERGNRVPDFSHCGYQGGGAAIPDVPVRVVVAPVKGDNGARIQAAIDYVSRLPADGQGLRGAVLLKAGRYEVAGGLRIAAGGVVLRGQGQGPNGTVLVAAGNDRRALIRVAGKADQFVSDEARPVAEPYVPVGARRLALKTTRGLRVGDRVVVEHPGTAAWVSALGMDRFPPGPGGSWLNWPAGKMGVRWERVVSGIDGDALLLDAPLTAALDASLSSAAVRASSWPGRISQVGVENLRCESAYDRDNPRDEEHAWMAVTLEAAENAWARQVSTAHFAGSAVAVWEGCRCVTVEDCDSLRPVSEVGGHRRRAFYTSGQQTLFRRCRSEHGLHDFAVGHLAPGPNAFVGCEASAALGFSGPIESWATGVLYDNVTIDGAGLELTNRETDGHGAGWAAANSVLWQCSASVIVCRRPPTAQNWAAGCWGQFKGDGLWQSLNQAVRPASLYEGQLLERLGPAASSLKRREIPALAGDARSIEELAPELLRPPHKDAGPARPLSVRNGWLVCDGQLLVGGGVGTAWWRGHVLPSRAGEMGPGVTRFVPGRDGPGWTDDLDRLTDALRADGKAFLNHHYGLWYDRRRDDHEMIRRMDGDVWAPFYEQPWARSGKGAAWDGLSKYDLTRFNPWYFGRLKEFAGHCDRKGLVLLHQAYFQHNLLEAGAHWADFPWRPANCLQDTGFPEPPPYRNQKRVFMAEAFYDVTHPERRALHRAYIRHCLDVLGEHSNVIFFTGEEYTGPLPFVQFWIDVIAEWEKDTGKRVLIGLSCTKDVQDAILADPRRGPRVAVIDLKYWWYGSDGSLYAPRGGQDLSPRQHEREWVGNKKRSDAQVARQVREYRDRYPDKAVLCSLDRANGWSVLAAGGSIPDLPGLKDRGLLEALPRMRPFEPGSGLAEGQWALAEPGRRYLVYAASGGKVRLDLAAEQGAFEARRLDPRTNRFAEAAEEVRGGGMAEIAAPGPGPWVLWLSRKERP